MKTHPAYELIIKKRGKVIKTVALIEPPFPCKLYQIKVDGNLEKAPTTISKLCVRQREWMVKGR